MNEFEKLVKKMRDAQREYFKTRQTYWLREAKKYEGEVDKFLKSINQPQLKFD